MTEKFDFLKLAAERFSVRSFKKKEIEDELLNKILRAGQLAPTACNFQPLRIVVVRGEEGAERIKKCTPCHFDSVNALLVCYNKDECYKREYDGKDSGDIDASIVATHMMLEAHSLGIGSTWVMHFIPEAVIEEFNVPDNFVPVVLLVMGYPADDVKPSHRHEEVKPLESMVSYDKF